MALPPCFEPANARITIPALLAVGYALYHVWRWRKNHPKAGDDETDTTPAAPDVPVGSQDDIRPTVSNVSSPGPDVIAEPQDDVPAPTPDPRLAEAERLWAEACEKVHGEIPDYSTDWQYMSLLYKAAELGHVEAMSWLGDYALLREELVEAFYWKLSVELRGGVCRNPTLNDIIHIWEESGCDEEIENVKAGFSERQRTFAHAVLLLKSGVDPRCAVIRLKELVAEDEEDAKLFLRRM